ncbi:MAG: hypothetical protein EOO77_19715 [Oxalobacteraceae bacterium]|nr:MAG: hypothetical protein EOO77_19715 [Oxalobacteraceae bacterium]
MRTRLRLAGSVVRMLHLLVGLIGIAAASCAAIITFLVWQVDQDARDRLQVTVDGALKHQQVTLSNALVSTAHWDDAAEHIYGTLDGAWAATNLVGYSSHSYVIDEHGRTLFGRLIGGKPAPDLARVLDASTIRALLRQAPQTEERARKQVAATVVMTRFDGRPTMVASMPIVFASSKRLNSVTLRHLVNVAEINTTMVEGWSRTYGVRGLHWRRGNEAVIAGRSLRVTDFSGRNVGTLTWDEIAPGRKAFRQIMPAVVGLTVFLLVVSMMLGTLILRSGSGLEEARVRASEAAEAERLARDAAEQALVDVRHAHKSTQALARAHAEEELRHKEEMRNISHAVADTLEETITQSLRQLGQAAGSSMPASTPPWPRSNGNKQMHRRPTLRLTWGHDPYCRLSAMSHHWPMQSTVSVQKPLAPLTLSSTLRIDQMPRLTQTRLLAIAWRQ